MKVSVGDGAQERFLGWEMGCPLRNFDAIKMCKGFLLLSGLVRLTVGWRDSWRAGGKGVQKFNEYF